MQKTFKNQHGREFIFCRVSQDACNFRISTGFPDPPFGDLSYDTKLNAWQTGNVILPKGNYQILCLAKDATEEQAKLIVDKPNVGETVYDGWHLDKLQILLTSLGFKQDDNVLILEKI